MWGRFVQPVCLYCSSLWLHATPFVVIWWITQSCMPTVNLFHFTSLGRCNSGFLYYGVSVLVITIHYSGWIDRVNGGVCVCVRVCVKGKGGSLLKTQKGTLLVELDRRPSWQLWRGFRISWGNPSSQCRLNYMGQFLCGYFRLKDSTQPHTEANIVYINQHYIYCYSLILLFYYYY